MDLKTIPDAIIESCRRQIKTQSVVIAEPLLQETREILQLWLDKRVRVFTKTGELSISYNDREEMLSSVIFIKDENGFLEIAKLSGSAKYPLPEYLGDLSYAASRAVALVETIAENMAAVALSRRAEMYPHLAEPRELDKAVSHAAALAARAFAKNALNEWSACVDTAVLNALDKNQRSNIGLYNFCVQFDDSETRVRAATVLSSRLASFFPLIPRQPDVLSNRFDPGTPEELDKFWQLVTEPSVKGGWCWQPDEAMALALGLKNMATVSNFMARAPKSGSQDLDTKVVTPLRDIYPDVLRSLDALPVTQWPDNEWEWQAFLRLNAFAVAYAEDEEQVAGDVLVRLLANSPPDRAQRWQKLEEHLLQKVGYRPEMYRVRDDTPYPLKEQRRALRRGYAKLMRRIQGFNNYYTDFAGKVIPPIVHELAQGFNVTQYDVHDFTNMKPHGPTRRLFAEVPLDEMLDATSRWHESIWKGRREKPHMPEGGNRKSDLARFPYLPATLLTEGLYERGSLMDSNPAFEVALRNIMNAALEAEREKIVPLDTARQAKIKPLFRLGETITPE